MTPEQIKNWRNILCVIIGPYALMMPEEKIIALRDKMQANINKAAKEMENDNMAD